MSISSIYSQNPSITAAPGSTGFGQSRFQQIQQQFSALGNALSTGNLQGAQTAFASLQALQPQPNGQSTSPATSNSQTPQNGFQSALASLGQSLSTGDLSGAQKAFSQLQSLAKTQHKGHHHHRDSDGGSSSSSSSASSPAASLPAGSTFQVSA